MTTPAPTGSPSAQSAYPPYVFLGGLLKQYQDANSSTTAVYDAIVQSTVAAFTVDGLKVKYVPVRSFINQNSATDMNCGSSNSALHLCDAGILQWRDAIESVMLPLAH